MDDRCVIGSDIGRDGGGKELLRVEPLDAANELLDRCRLLIGIRNMHWLRRIRRDCVVHHSEYGENRHIDGLLALLGDRLHLGGIVLSNCVDIVHQRSQILRDCLDLRRRENRRSILDDQRRMLADELVDASPVFFNNTRRRRVECVTELIEENVDQKELQLLLLPTQRLQIRVRRHKAIQ